MTVLNHPGFCPESHRFAALTVDLDGESVWHRAGQGAPAPLHRSQGRFGPSEGVWNLVALFEEFDLPATFFVPGVVAEAYPDLVADLADRGYEIGAHGYTHVHPTRLSEEEERQQLIDTVSVLHGITGQQVLGYRAPGYQVSPHTFNILASEGLMYDSSLMDSERPYVGEEGVVEIPASWSLDDWALYGESTAEELATLMPASQVAAALQYEFEARSTARALFVVVIHPQLSGRVSRVRAWREFLQEARKDAEMPWTTLGDLARRVREGCGCMS